ncbi:MAG: reverse transcriptase domain-containing protein, partial [Holophagaceae bacterium]
DVFGMRTDAQFVNTLEDIIRERGAPHRLLSDSAIVIRSSRVKDILRALFIGQWTSKPHRQHQNVMERRYQSAKRLTNLLLDRSGCPESCWLLCLQYVCTVLNCSACKSLDWEVPLTVLLGVTVDVSPLLRFYWYQPVLFATDHASFPSTSKEDFGYFVGISTHCGHAMTFKILTNDTNKIIHRSQVRPANDPSRPNLRLTELLDGEVPSKVFVRSKFESIDPSAQAVINPDSGEIEQLDKPTMVPIEVSQLVDTSELIGRTFLMPGREEGTTHRARIVEMITDERYEASKDPEDVTFKLSVNNDEYQTTMAYGEVLNYINKDGEQEVLWKYKCISGHQGPLTSKDKDYKGSAYNVRVEWENGEVSYEPLNVFANDDPVACAVYAKDNDLLNTPGWKRFKQMAKRDRVLRRLVNQAKLRSFNQAPRYKYGYEIPRNYDHAIYLDQRNGNTKWQDANALEFGQLFEYSTFRDLGHWKDAKPPPGYKKIKVHLVFDVKHDGRHKVRVVADGHLTDIPVDSVYSGVVSLKGLRIMIFLAELNHLETWATDIGNAYLEAKTREKLYIVAGPEFAELEGHLLVIEKALYGLRSSGKRWHERFAECLVEEGFKPCKVEPDIWMRPSSDKSCYEMVAVYVDDLAFGMKNPKAFLEVLERKHQFKLKGSGPISFHLGCDFERDKDGTLCMVPRQYIERMIGQYERMFGSKPKTNVTSPLEKGDHPESDKSDLLDPTGIQQYQSLIGSLQWAVTIGRFDITTAVMTMSSFRAAPRVGHLERAKRIVAYLCRFPQAKIRFCTHEPDLSDLHVPMYDWNDTPYDCAPEEIPNDVPPPLGKHVVTVSYVDANLMHDVSTGKSVTGILHFLNAT